MTCWWIQLLWGYLSLHQNGRYFTVDEFKNICLCENIWIFTAFLANIVLTEFLQNVTLLPWHLLRNIENNMICLQQLSISEKEPGVKLHPNSVIQLVQILLYEGYEKCRKNVVFSQSCHTNNLTFQITGIVIRHLRELPVMCLDYKFQKCPLNSVLEWHMQGVNFLNNNFECVLYHQPIGQG